MFGTVQRLPLKKLTWILRYAVYKVVYNGFNGLGYFGKPVYTSGLSRFSVRNGLGIYPGSRIEILGDGSVSLGKNVRIGQNFFLESSAAVVIGDNVTFSSDVFVGTTKYMFDSDGNSNFLSSLHESRPISIGDNCFLGKGVVVLPGTNLGDGCIVGANCVLSGRFPRGSVIAQHRPEIIRNRFD